jgi:hypothetical protein
MAFEVTESTDPSIAVERVDILDILFTQVKVCAMQIMLDPGFSNRFRNGNNTSLRLK